MPLIFVARRAGCKFIGVTALHLGMILCTLGTAHACSEPQRLCVQRAHAELADLEASFKGRAESSQAALEKLVESKEKREQDLYVKVFQPLLP